MSQDDLLLALYRIADKAASDAPLPDLYLSIHQILSGLMYAKNFYIALYDAEHQTVSFPYFVDEKDKDCATGARPMGEGLTEYVVRTGQPLLATPERFRELCDRGDVKLVGTPCMDWLGVPLRKGDQTIGVLAVQTYEDNTRYGEEEKKILTFVSQQVASAIQHKRAEAEREELIQKLQEALANMKTLHGLLPICASCKRIRDDRGNWKHIESYIHAHSDASFTHGMCPECASKLYPEDYKLRA